MKEQSRPLKAHITGSPTSAVSIGTVHIVGYEPESRPYVWIGDAKGSYVASIDARQMDALCREWQKRRKAK